MNRPIAKHVWVPLAAGLAALALAGCGGKSETPAPQPSDVTTAAEQEQPAATSSAPSEQTPEIAPEIAPAPAPETAPETAPEPDVETPAETPTDETTKEAPAKSAAQPTAEERAAKAATDGADALKWLEDREAKKAEYQRSVTEASAKVAEADAQVAEWERNLLAIRNPYLPRPQFSREDTAAISGKVGEERVQYVEKRLADLRAERDAAQKHLDDLKANPPN